MEIPYQRLSPEALRALVEEYVTRDGTDYGAAECALETKAKAVRLQLERGEVAIVFDPATSSCDIVLTRTLRERERAGRA